MMAGHTHTHHTRRHTYDGHESQQIVQTMGFKCSVSLRNVGVQFLLKNNCTFKSPYLKNFLIDQVLQAERLYDKIDPVAVDCIIW